MPFTKNDTKINRAGRPKGSTSYSGKLRSLITDFLEEESIEFLQEIKKMKPSHAKAQAYISLLNYALPKLTESNSVIDIENLTASDVDKLFNRLVNEPE